MLEYYSQVISCYLSNVRIRTNILGKKLEAFMAEMRAEMHTNPPLPGAYTPKKGDLCAAKFVDELWYRARVEKVRPPLTLPHPLPSFFHTSSTLFSITSLLISPQF